jgi:hypothetical protein
MDGRAASSAEMSFLRGLETFTAPSVMGRSEMAKQNFVMF